MITPCIIKNETHEQDAPEIICLIDSSGSPSFQKTFIPYFNAFLKTQQALPSPAKMSIAFFDNQLRFANESTPLHEIMPLSGNYFSTVGKTALLDGIGRTINALKATMKKKQVIMAIFTHGQESGSWEFSTKRISKMLHKRLQKKHWQIFLFTANQATILNGLQLGINPRYCIYVDEGNEGLLWALTLFEYACFVKRHYHTLFSESPLYHKADFNTLSYSFIQQELKTLKAYNIK